MCLHLRVVWLLYLHCVNCWSSLANGRHLKLQCIHRSLQDFILGLAAILSSLSCAVALVNPSSARWRSSRLFARPCGTPIPLFALRRHSDATNYVFRRGNVLQSSVRISHSLQSRVYNPDLCRLRYAIPISSVYAIGRDRSAFPWSC